MTIYLIKGRHLLEFSSHQFSALPPDQREKLLQVGPNLVPLLDVLRDLDFPNLGGPPGGIFWRV